MVGGQRHGHGGPPLHLHVVALSSSSSSLVAGKRAFPADGGHGMPDGDGGSPPSSAQLPARPPGAPPPPFALPVDAELKATSLRLLSAARPHMRAFHVAWLSFFAAFVSVFAPAGLLPVLRESLDLSASDIGNAGIASVCGAIASRVLAGSLTDVLGPRYGAGLVLLGTAPCVFGLAAVRSAAGFVALRACVGLALSMFVVNQAWITGMFNTSLVGRANALAAGWGNMGGGASLLLAPVLYSAFARLLPSDIAWRLVFFVPGVAQVCAGVLVLAATDDTPLGRLPAISSDWCRFGRGKFWQGWRGALANYRTHVAGLAYGLSFGVELTVHNVVSLYLFNHFGLSLTAAGLLGGGLGLSNLVSRFAGGLASDMACRLRGMRGRLWVLQALLMAEGAFCLLVGLSHNSLAATVGTLLVFSFFCQTACGAVFGVVPFISKRSTAFVAGLVAAYGNLGSAVTQAVFFSYFDFTPYEGFYWMGATIICLSAVTNLLYWPMWGGMCCGPRAGSTEERYYIEEYSPPERAAGLHLPSLAFAHESRSERDSWRCGGCGKAPPQPPLPPGVAHPSESAASRQHSRAALLPSPPPPLSPLSPPSLLAQQATR